MDRDLILAAAKLQRTAPESFKEFLGAFEAFTNQSRDNCVSSPLETLPQNQGRAQVCVALLKGFRDCLKLADQIEKAKNK
jgi:FtsZ-interacting cell division protein YlmF